MARYITLEMGKTITEAREEVFELGISNFEHAIGEVQDLEDLLYQVPLNAQVINGFL